MVAPSTRLLACLALSVLGVSACGGDDGAAGDSNNSTDTGGSEMSETDTGGEEPDANLIEIPGGSFEMGCGANDVPCDTDNPAHQITISGFWMEATEVSVAAYTECVDAGACTAPTAGDGCNYGALTMAAHPVNCVTWQQAADYCAWKGRRLPTEAEWEYAATGGLDRKWPWGDSPATCALAHMYEVVDQMGDYGCMTGQTAPVDSYPTGASPFGMLNMAGNVDEWVADWYAADYYSSSPATDPQGPADGTLRVNRGGDMFDASELNLRVFERWKAMPDVTGPERGFRCAAD